MTTEAIQLSIVVPVYNEEENIRPLHAEIKEVCERVGYVYEIIFVDDGSTDGTERMAAGLSPMTYLKLRKNFGQTAAMDAGIKSTQYPYIVTMDGDRQNDPADIPRLVEHLRSGGYNVVSGWRKNRKDPFMKRFVSRGANLLRKLLVHDDIQDSGCSLKVYERSCFENLNLYGEMHRFIPAILRNKGYRIGELVVNHRPRVAGMTKYNWRRMFKGFLDMISVWFWDKYAVRPLHLLGSVAFIMFFCAILTTIVGLTFYINDIALFSKVLPIVSVFFYLTSIQFIMFGLLGDMLSKSYFNSSKEQSYNIERITRR